MIVAPLFLVPSCATFEVEPAAQEVTETSDDTWTHPETEPDDGRGSGSGTDTGSTDSGTTDSGVTTWPGELLLPRCEDREPAGTTDLPWVASTLVATIEPAVDRVDALAVDWDLNPTTDEGELGYGALGFGDAAHGPGQERIRRADLGGSTSFGTRRSIAWFAVLSDFQLADDESPVRWVNLDNPIIGSTFRPQEGLAAHGISAMSRTLDQIEDATRELDFGIVTGDCADNGQTNENRWVKELMDGRPGVETDSGDDDDPVPGPANDPKDPLDPFGFPAPWLMVVGNHDLHVVGMLTPTADQQALALGTTATLGTRDYTSWYAPPTTGPVAADPERIQLSRAELVDSLWDTEPSPGPLGHGFPEGSDTSVGANWVTDPIPGLLRILSWDSSDPDGGSEGMMLESTVEGWLLPELARAEEDGVLVIFASHHPSTSVDRKEGQFGSDRDDALEEDEVEALLAEHPQVIAWLAGHEHDRRVRPIAGLDAQHPGLWEVMTPSLNDWPQQGRTIELVDNDNGTLSLFATLHDYATESCLERRYRRLALIDWTAGWSYEVSDADEDMNVELVIPLPAGAAAAVRAASGTSRIESETGLDP